MKHREEEEEVEAADKAVRKRHSQASMSYIESRLVMITAPCRLACGSAIKTAG